MGVDDFHHEYDGRPPVYHPQTDDDELLARLFEVHGQEYAEELLRKDAAMRRRMTQRQRR
jgi:hypothetical protein